MLGKALTLDGAEAVQAVYREWTRVAQSVFYTEDEKLAVSDHMIVSTSTVYQQTQGPSSQRTARPSILTLCTW